MAHNCQHCGGELTKTAPARSGMARVVYACAACGRSGFWSKMVAGTGAIA